MILKKTLVFILIIMLLSGCETQKEMPDSGDDDVNVGEWIVNTSASKLTLAVYSLDTFQPIATKSTSVTDAMMLVYEPLFKLDDTLKPVGALANGYSISSDGLTVEVTLKSGVKWHDGSGFSAKDVDYTVKAIMQGDSVYKSYLRNVVSYSTSGNNKYVFKLSRPTANFAAMLVFPIIKNGTDLTVNPNYVPIGTGPYKYAGKRASKRVKLSRNDEWHNQNTGMKNIEISILKDRETAIDAFEANEVSCLSSKTINLNQYTPRGKLLTADYVSNNMVYLGINFHKQVLWGQGTRQALGYIIDKEEIVEKQVYKRGTAVDVPVNPSAWYYNSESKMYFYSSEDARMLILHDGWNKDDWGYSRIINDTETKLKLEILVNAENEEKVNIANAVAKYLINNEIGAEVKAVPYSEYSELLNQKQFDLFIGETVMPNGMDPSFLIGSGGNCFTYSSPQMDTIVSNMGKVQSDEAVKAVFKEFSDFFNTDIPFVPLFFRKDTLIYDDTVSGNILPNISDVYGGITQWYTE